MIKIDIIKGWQFRQGDKNEWFSATVPGCVHTDLLKNNLIDDPFFGTNEAKCQWIELKDWEYRTEFEINEEALLEEEIELVFEGLDTYATVLLNGKTLRTSDNMFRTWRIPIKKEIEPGKNDLTVVFESPVNKELPNLAKLQFRYHAVQDNDVEASPLTRKAPYHYGWDWGPRFVTSGIWRPARIEAFSKARIDSIFIIQKEISKVSAKLQLETEFTCDKNTKATVRLTNCKSQEILVETPVEILAGDSKFNFDFEIFDPQLWYPNGYGDPNLYDFRVDVLINGKVKDTEKTRAGLRTIELKRIKDKWGESFEFIVNGEPIFVKGANWIPADSFVTAIEDSRYRKLIESGKEVHFNMLRVWGGGIYEKDIFYDLCDENGILVWQDFMFACSLFPADDGFLENVKYEAVDNIKRLRNHPSLTLWCGNNENEWIYDFDGNGMKNRFGQPEEEILVFKEDYEKLNNKLLKELVAKYNPNLGYWPSSPSSDYKANANNDNYGDIHHWDVWHMGYPVESYKKLAPRFISEFGFQSMPDPLTIDSFLENEQRFLGSPAMQTHQKHERGYSLIKTYLERSYPHPKDFDGFCYLSQIQQADFMKFAIEHFRSVMPKCMGILYWQLNDCWPVCSWASIDYELRWKAFHYYAKKFYAPTMVYPVLEDGSIIVKLIADTQEVSNAKLHWKLLDLGGDVLKKGISSNLTANKNTAETVLNLPLNSFGNQLDTSNNYLLFELIKEDKVIVENRFLFEKVKNIKLKKPKIVVDLAKMNEKLQVTLTSSKYAKGVFLRFEDDEGFFEDNYFDLDANRPYSLNYSPQNQSLITRENLRIISLVDMIEQN